MARVRYVDTFLSSDCLNLTFRKFAFTMQSYYCDPPVHLIHKYIVILVKCIFLPFTESSFQTIPLVTLLVILYSLAIFPSLCPI